MFLDGKFMISKDSINKFKSDTKYLKEIDINEAKYKRKSIKWIYL